MKKEIVQVAGTKPVRHLSRAVRFGNLVFVAGTTGSNWETGRMPEDVAGQTRQTMENIKACLEAAGTGMENVLKMTCYLVDLKDKQAFNEVYVSYFPQDPPARACVGVADLEPGVLVEIETIAAMPE